MGKWIDSGKSDEQRPLGFDNNRSLMILQQGPRRRRRPVRTGPFVIYLLFLLGIVVYWYAVFSKTELAITVPPPVEPTKKPIVTQKLQQTGPQQKKTEYQPISGSQQKIVNEARRQFKSGVRYTNKYFRLIYPGGDVPADLGLNVDLVIRALRMVGVDLQKRVHEDLIRDPAAYPLFRWANHKPDYNIDHRRLANLQVFLDRYATRLTRSLKKPEKWQAGDIVVWATRSRGHSNHIGIVSRRRNDKGVPYVYEMHHIDGRVAGHRLVNHWAIRRHYRWEKAGNDLKRLTKAGN